MNQVETLSMSNKEYNDRAIKALGAAFLFYAGSYSIKPIFHSLGVGALESLGSLVFYVIWAYHLLSAMCVGKTLKISLLLKVLAFDGLFLGIIYVNSILFPMTSQYYEECAMFFRQILIVFIPCGVLLAQVYDFSNAFQLLSKYALFGSIVMIVSLAFGYMNYWDYQYWGVQLSPFILILFANYMKKKRGIDLLFFLVDGVLILLGGRQSFIVVVMAGLILYIFDNRKKSVRMVAISVTAVIGGILLISSLYTYIFQGLNGLMNALGLHMETLERIADGKLFDTSTRDIIYEYSFLTILSNGAKVSGLLADRYYLRNFGQYTSWILYPHNIYLELLIDFGTVIGTVISILLTISVVRNMFIKGTEQRKRVGIVLCMLTMVRLLVSSSFVIEGNFYIMLGFLFGCYGYSRRYKMKKRSMLVGDNENYGTEV